MSSRVFSTLMVGLRRCCFLVWVRVREVFGLFRALRAGLPAGADDRLLAPSVLGGLSCWRVMLLQFLGVRLV